MPDEINAQAVKWEVGSEAGQVWMRFTSPGVRSLTITVDPQAAFEQGEMLARAAHAAQFGEAPASDAAYLQEQIRNRVTEQLRGFMITRIGVMLNSLRTSHAYSNKKLAATLVDTILTKLV